MSSTPALGSRALFPDLEARAYVNHASIAPLSTPVSAAVEALVADYRRRGFDAFAAAYARREGLREKLARLVGARSSDIAFVPSTTHGVSAIALCFPWKRGDRVLLFEGEFPTNVTPWQQAAELYGLECVFHSAELYREDEEEALLRLRRELEAGVRMVAVSAVEFQTGFRMPVRRMSELCRAASARLFVDAIQALGAVPFDVVEEGVDFLACGSHKWLMALDGLAFVYACEESASELRPRVAGWLSHEDPVSFLSEGGESARLRYDRPIRESIDFLEGGSLSTVSAVALEVSLEILLELGPAAIFDHVNAYNDALEPRLEELGFGSLRAPRHSARSGSLSVVPPPGVALGAIHERLRRDGVVCSIPDGRLRFSPHWPNPLEEVDVVFESVSRAVDAG